MKSPVQALLKTLHGFLSQYATGTAAKESTHRAIPGLSERTHVEMRVDGPTVVLLHHPRAPTMSEYYKLPPKVCIATGLHITVATAVEAELEAEAACQLGNTGQSGRTSDAHDIKLGQILTMPSPRSTGSCNTNIEITEKASQNRSDAKVIEAVMALVLPASCRISS